MTSTCTVAEAGAPGSALQGLPADSAGWLRERLKPLEVQRYGWDGQPQGPIVMGGSPGRRSVHLPTVKRRE